MRRRQVFKIIQVDRILEVYETISNAIRLDGMILIQKKKWNKEIFGIKQKDVEIKS